MELPNMYYLLVMATLYLTYCSKGTFGKVLEYKVRGSTNEYDFVVVGGGTAGCTVASRLSENLKYSVLLIEAGGIPNPDLTIPAITEQHMNDPVHVKEYKSVPQRYAGLANGGVLSYKVGRTLGGSSTINGMLFSRGNPFDYDNWSNLTGDPSWSYQSLLKYFKKMETYRGDYPLTGQHGNVGPITITRPTYAPGLDEWLEAGQFFKFPIADPNGPQKISFGAAEFAKRFGRRVSSYAGYISPFMGSRPNLNVITNSEVKRVTFKGNSANGVIFRKSGESNSTNYFVRAKREIILSAGVIGSPEILMKSGIGPKDVLDSMRIPPVKYLPVGMNLQDHPILSLRIILSNRSAAFIPERDLNPQSFQFYNRYGDGPYSNYLSTCLAFITSSVAERFKSWPDVELMYQQDTLTFGETEDADHPKVTNNEVVVSAFVYLTRPKSRGRVSLNTTSGEPSIDLQFFSHPDDMQAMIEGIRIILKIFEETPSFKRLGVRYSSQPIQACKHVLPFRSQKYWRCFVKQRAISGLHGSGTCKMGRGKGDLTAVVDSDLKVIGVKHLRVADNSIMPHVTNSNTMAAAYLIGEKAADIILSRLH